MCGLSKPYFEHQKIYNGRRRRHQRCSYARREYNYVVDELQPIKKIIKFIIDQQIEANFYVLHNWNVNSFHQATFSIQLYQISAELIFQ